MKRKNHIFFSLNFFNPFFLSVCLFMYFCVEIERWTRNINCIIRIVLLNLVEILDFFFVWEIGMGTGFVIKF